MKLNTIKKILIYCKNEFKNFLIDKFNFRFEVSDSNNSLNDTIIINSEILSDEILVRYVFTDDFKRKSVSEEKIITKELLGPLRGGTSLQRERYCDEQNCYDLGSIIPNKELVAFLIFKKADFQNVLIDFITSEENDCAEKILEAYLKATPLDEHFNYINMDTTTVTTKTKGNPAHADLIYLKPQLIPNGTDVYEKPNSTIRSFSKKMYLHSKLVIFGFHPDTTLNCRKFKEFYN